VHGKIIKKEFLMNSMECFSRKTNKPNNSHRKSKSQCLLFPQVQPEARIRLFCFPYAGGGAHIYFPWQAQLPDWIEICAIQLPGRGMRFADIPYSQHQPIIEQVLDAIKDYMDKPYAIFGHSMGALLAYELAQAIEQSSLAKPEHLFVSGRRAMHIPSSSKAIYNLDDKDLIAELRQLNGTPAEVLANQELMNLLLPVIRADFKLCDTYEYNEQYESLNINITTFEGSQDHKAQGKYMTAWKDLTSGDVNALQLAGDHFFIHSQEQQLLTLLKDKLLSLL
jgi:medium-chain acyl-[acyl-carrier-protein] hydrolase